MAAIPRPPRNSIRGLEIARTATDFIVSLNWRSFSTAKRRFSCSSMPKALTMRFPVMVSWSSEMRSPMETWDSVAMRRILRPNWAMG